MTSTAYFIIIRGPLGVGKTTVSKKLVQILNADYISIDEVLEKRGLDKMDEKEGTIPAKNFIAANEFVLDKVKKTISSGKIVIFDGCFHQREQLDHLLRYLHLNPSTANLVEKPEDWPYSSYGEYLRKVDNKLAICQYEDIIDVIPSSYRKFVNDQISYQRELARIKNLIIE